MRKLHLALCLLSLALSVACGSSSNNNNGSGCTTGNFSNASMSGNFTYQIQGVDLTAGVEFREAGVFVSDGAGNITSGTDDLVQGSLSSLSIVASTYSIASNGTGTINLNFSDGSTLQAAITSVSSTKLYLVVSGVVASGTLFPVTGTGVIEHQNSAAFVLPSGNFTFSLHSSNGLVSNSTVGMFNVNGVGTVSGNDDVNLGGTSSPSSVSGTLTTPDTLGRGAGSSITDSGGTTSLIYYVVDANNLRFLNVNSNTVGIGRAETQTAATYTAASLTGGYAFGSVGDTTLSGTLGSQTVGQFPADGIGGISIGGAFDNVKDGTQSLNIGISGGSYTVASSGRGTATLNLSVGGSISVVFWLVSPSRGFFQIVNDTSRVEDGTFDQQSGTFSNSTATGQFTLLMHGFTFAPATLDRVGDLTFDGGGGLTLFEFVNSGGTTNVPGCLSGTYSVSANGRTSGTISGLSNNLIFYLVNGSNTYVLQNDSGVEVSGVATKQQ